MSNSLAIAAVTRTLRDLLFAGINAKLGGTHVTTQAPDIARSEHTINQLNVFLYLTTIDAAWRNMDMPGRVHPGEIGFPPLPLILHYMITAYGKDDDDAVGHLVLGHALSVLHDRPLLAPADLRTSLPDSDLDGQVERVRITAETLSIDEMSRLWTTFQTQYRISAAYQASVVLIDSNLPVKAALPVLSRGSDDRGPVATSKLAPPPVPTLESAALTGTDVALHGHDLDGSAVAVRMTHPALSDPIALTGADLTAASATDIAFALPAGIPAGTLTVVVLVTRGGPPIATNEVTLAIAPRITSPLPLQAVRDGAGEVAISIDVAAPIVTGQQAFLLAGSAGIPAAPFTPPASTLQFHFAIEPGIYVVRLRVGGVDSDVVDHSVTPPAFLADQRLVVT